MSLLNLPLSSGTDCIHTGEGDGRSRVSPIRVNQGGSGWGGLIKSKITHFGSRNNLMYFKIEKEDDEIASRRWNPFGREIDTHGTRDKDTNTKPPAAFNYLIYPIYYVRLPRLALMPELLPENLSRTNQHLL